MRQGPAPRGSTRPPAPAPEVTTLLLDLDGTLVDIRECALTILTVFLMARRFAGVASPWTVGRELRASMAAVKADGSKRTNHEVFLSEFSRRLRVPRNDVERRVDRVLSEDLAVLAPIFRPVPGARETVAVAQGLGYRLVLATNPLWPLATVELRLAKAGLAMSPFSFVTHNAVMTRCKPQVEYYRELLTHLDASGEECVMVGNDPVKDLAAEGVGIRTFLLDRGPGRSSADVPAGTEVVSLAEIAAWLVRSRQP